jgi:pimeloyl-ACP methyl ester carboxylesterase
MVGMSIRRVHVHGAGRRGSDAWPSAADEAGAFVSFPPAFTVSEQVERLVQDFGSEPVIVYAHSIGAVPAALAARRMQIAGLVLVEPALYDIARGEESIERHIGIVTEARAQAAAGDLKSFWAILRPLMFGSALDVEDWERERPVAEHWATTNLPWGHGVRQGMLHGIATLVVTGGWNEEYERIAQLLIGVGAQHVVLAGAQHRPMDLPAFAEAALAFEASL